jgi:hypothetical protein
MEYGSGGKQMAKDVHVGNNVVMKCDDDIDEDYWILLCDKGLYMIQQGLKDGWGQDWFRGNWVIQCVWYERLQPSSRLYILLKDSTPTFVFSHLIVASKFKMPPTTHSVRGSNVIYELTVDVIGIIHLGLDVHRLVNIDQEQ